jgi:hypothetical protein
MRGRKTVFYFDERVTAGRVSKPGLERQDPAFGENAGSEEQDPAYV